MKTVFEGADDKEQVIYEMHVNACFQRNKRNSDPGIDEKVKSIPTVPFVTF